MTWLLVCSAGQEALIVYSEGISDVHHADGAFPPP